MNPAYWGIVAVLVVGIAVVLYGALTDRRTTRRQQAALTASPERDIPGLNAERNPPHYVTEAQAHTRPPGHPTELTEARRLELADAIKIAPRLAAGYGSRDFVTDAATGWCVLDQPLVLCCADSVTTMRELLSPIAAAKAAGQPLVVVAPSMTDEVRDTLAVNSLQGLLPNLVLSIPDEDLRARAAELTGATPVSESDLRAGYLPASTYGYVATWVADGRSSWVLKAEGSQVRL